MNRLMRNLFVFFLIFLSAGFLYLFHSLEQRLPYKNFSQLLQDLDHGKIVSLEFKGDEVTATDKSDYSYTTVASDIHHLVSDHVSNDVIITFHKDHSTVVILAIIALIVMIIMVITIVSLNPYSKQAKRKKFGSDKMITPQLKGKVVTFDDVAGIPEAKEELEEIVSFLKNARHFTQVGASLPKGILLQGPPGTGKTLVARAIAGEAGVPFFSFSGSDFVEMFVGVGASRVRDIFKEAKEFAPCIIFIDEIDAMGARRIGSSVAGGQDERSQTLNALLVELDGFSPSDSIIVLAATNRPDILDPALKRPGRFDRQVNILPPDVKGRRKILEIHSRKIKKSRNVDLNIVASMTPGFTGADLANLINEAALMAARKKKEVVDNTDFEKARERIQMGVERKGIIMTKKQRKILASHEAGHAVIAKSLPNSDPLHKITIIPRGKALGQTQQLPLNDRHAYSYEYLKNRITILMGGRAAEEVVFNRKTTGCQDDLYQATDIATNMICKWGMSEKLGPRAYSMDSGGFIGSLSQTLAVGESTAHQIDDEINDLLFSCFLEAKGILKKNDLFFRILSDMLFEVETLDHDEIDIIYECALRKKEHPGSYQKNGCSECPYFETCFNSEKDQ